MNKLFKHLTLLLLVLSIVSCTEEISEEVQNTPTSTATSGTSSTPADLSSYSIRLTHKMDSKLSYLMHKAGNKSAACELKAPTLGFDPNTYDKSSAASAIDCILDVQELDLHFHGANIELQVDDHLCEYLTFKPYSFVAFPYGSSNGNQSWTINCDEVCKADATVGSYCDKTYDTFVEAGVTAEFTLNEYLNQISKPEAACLYDWSAKYGTESGYPNCDLGKRLSTTVDIKSVDHDSDSTTANVCGTSAAAAASRATVTFTTPNEYTDCGGSIKACLGGAGVDFMVEEKNSISYTDFIFENTNLEAFTREFSFPAPNSLGHFSQNLHLANYSRICSNTDTKKSGNYDSTVFKGYQIENINHQDWVSGLDKDATTGATVGYKYSEHPFHAWQGASPYYEVSCLDKAHDVKAKVRLFIREWDKEFTATNNLIDKVSDIYLDDNAPTVADGRYMDLADDTYDTSEAWNDLDDWDDIFTDQKVFNGGTGNGGDQCLYSDEADSNNDGSFDRTTETYDYRLPSYNSTTKTWSNAAFPWYRIERQN